MSAETIDAEKAVAAVAGDVKSEDQKGERSPETKGLMMRVTLLLLGAIAVVLVTSLLWRNQRKNNETEDRQQSSLETFLISIVGGTDLLQEDTPQNNALQWMVDNMETPMDIENTTNSGRVLELYSMYVLYYSMNGREWVEEGGQDPCSWLWKARYNDISDLEAITCSKDGKVQDLHLSLMHGIEGTLPTELGLLSELSVIHMFSSNVTGSIPKELGHLRELYATDNQLTGTIPTSLHGVEVLWLGQNLLTGTIPAAVASSAREKRNGDKMLYLNDNLLTGSIPETLCEEEPNMDPDSYRWCLVDFSKNQLTGTIPPSLAHKEGLHWFYVSENKLTGTIPSFGPASAAALRDFALDGNLLTGTIPSSLGNMTEVETLDLHENQLTGTIPASLGRINGLYVPLNLYGNTLTGTLPASFNNLWYGFNVRDNGLTGTIPSWIPSWTGQNLMLANNSLSGTLPSKLSLSGILDLSFNSLTGTIPRTLFEEIPHNTSSLYLEGNFLEDAIPQEFCPLPFEVFSVSCDGEVDPAVSCTCCQVAECLAK